MMARKYRTLDAYKKAGCEMRLFKTLGGKLAEDISVVLTARDADKLLRALNCVERICSRAEDNMFNDHPSLTSEYLDVFYGTVGDKPRNDVDAEVIQLARETADELFRERH